MIDQDELTEPQTPLDVGDKRDAERLMRDLRRLRNRIAENAAVVNDTVNEARAWADRENKPLAERAEALELLLAGWMRARLGSDPRAPKSERLPSGEIVSRAGGVRVEITDEASFTAWAEKNRPSLLRRPSAPAPVPDRAAIKAALLPACGPDAGPGIYGAVAEGGEVVDGVVFIRDDRQVTIKPAPGGSWMHREEHGE